MRNLVAFVLWLILMVALLFSHFSLKKEIELIRDDEKPYFPVICIPAEK